MVWAWENNGMRYAYCIECRDETGKLGSFAFETHAPKVAISPIFSDLLDLYLWFNKNNWTTFQGDSKHPLGCHKHDDE